MPGRGEDRWPPSLTVHSPHAGEGWEEAELHPHGVVNERTAPNDVPPELPAIAQK